MTMVGSDPVLVFDEKGWCVVVIQVIQFPYPYSAQTATFSVTV